MRLRFLLTLLGVLWCAFAAADDPVGKINLRVLFAGKPGDARSKAFVGFLEEHFTKVGQASYSDFQPAMADQYDVVVFDSPASQGAAPKLPANFNRASVLISGAGVRAIEPVKAKLDWL
jgi:hypothetical protein